ncbi:MCP four helix bundle domain-containing protein [Edwardsiella ictaluri]|uniref:MCP four helix bundle domain-containing protein n=1 Tax=Edwardsiella ictaluri TaxID=67780 RepID=A0ABY8GIR2_EDWIC|nr:MCP four helix bundle domain-containing protein [Edwardsiella ictaluri]WFN97188.1 MCP four helix bundle domain-containing protein [Edwardsiella ictaluri]WFO08929.1 MCP four helix bundle domain-containing protein [Edwardsiella ictaluri]
MLAAVRSYFQRVTIGGRIVICFGVVLVLVLLLASVSVWQVGKIKSSLEQINDVNNVKQQLAVDLRGSVHDRAIALRDVVLVEPDALAPIVRDIARLGGGLSAGLAALGAAAQRQCRI